MDMLESWFTWGGRLPRMPYFLATLACSVAAFVIAIVLGFMLGVAKAVHGPAPGMSAGFLIGLLLMLGLVCVYAYISVNLKVQRLHDMDMSGLHVLWIEFLGLCFTISRAAHNIVIAGVFGLAVLGVVAWLLFFPGDDGGNRFGLQPI